MKEAEVEGPKVDRWDVFISHASEDKRDLVQPLASALSAFGVRVWYDEYELRVGDSLSRSIDAGLSRSDYGVVVLSPAFISKKWPEYELRGLNAREISGSNKVVLPVWYNVSRADVLKFSPPLADKFAIDAGSLTVVQIAVRIIEAVRPDVWRQIRKRIVWRTRLQRTSVRQVKVSSLRKGPILHPELPSDLMGRIRLVRAALFEVYPHSMGYWVDGFKRDAFPSKEIVFWEHVASAWLEYLSACPQESRPKRLKDAYYALLSGALGEGYEAMKEPSTEVPPQSLTIIEKVLSHAVPPYDIDEDIDDPGSSGDKDDVSAYIDMERFPQDLPEYLIRELLGLESESTP